MAGVTSEVRAAFKAFSIQRMENECQLIGGNQLCADTWTQILALVDGEAENFWDGSEFVPIVALYPFEGKK